MAKLIYEHDNGHRATFDFDAESFKKMGPLTQKNLLGEVFKVLEAEILAQSQGDTV